MFVPKSPTAPESFDNEVVFSLMKEGSHRLQGKRGVVVVHISCCLSERRCQNSGPSFQFQLSFFSFSVFCIVVHFTLNLSDFAILFSNDSYHSMFGWDHFGKIIAILQAFRGWLKWDI